MIRTILLFIALSFSSFVFAQEGKLKTIYVADSKIACQYNNTMMPCLKIKSHQDSNWSLFPYTIEGFNFEQGVEAKIVILETPILFPEDNGPKFTYKLSSVVETKNTVLTNKKLLTNNKWKLINLEKDFKFTPARKANGSFVFDLDSGLISGFGGCNSFGGKALYEDGTIQFGIINSTLLSCNNDDVEKMVMDGMKGKAAFYVRNNMLFIVCEDHLVMHLRPEKRLDSMIAELSKPAVELKGNFFKEIKPGIYHVILSDMGDIGIKQMTFTSVALNEVEKKTVWIKMINQDAESEIQEIHVLLKPHEVKGSFYATVILKDGRSQSVVINNGN